MFSCIQHSSAASGSVAAFNCVCNAGYEGAGNTTCTACSAGTYKTAEMLSCTDCPVNTYTPESASVTADACLACPILTISTAGADSLTECVAALGTFSAGAGTPAQFCTPSTYQDEINQVSCKLCPSGKYQPAYGAQTLSACLDCPVHSHLTNTGTSVHNCSCNPGYTGNDATQCVVCAAGKVKAEPGFAACDACGANTYASVDNTVCESCATDSASPSLSETNTACTCNAGYTGIDANDAPWVSGAITACAACEAGYYKGVAGNEACAACELGSYAPLPASLECQGCRPDTYTITVGSTQCADCLQNEFSASDSTSRFACVCVAGFYRDAGLCTPCSIGTFRNSSHAQANTSVCTSCAEGMYTDGTGSLTSNECLLCPQSFYIGSTGDCLACQAHAGSVAGSIGQSVCTCNAGYTTHDSLLHTCAACEAGKYKDFTGNDNCVLCPHGKTYDADDMSTPIPTGVLVENSCFDCPGNYYYHMNAVTEVGECLPCHGNSVSVAGAQNQSFCECLPGYGFDSNAVACIACAAGYYKPAQTNSPCLLCAQDAYQPAVAANSCLSCPQHSARMDMYAVGDDVGDCLCDPGYTGPDGGPCVLCADGTFKPVRGSDSCGHCGANAYFEVDASRAFSNCQACPEHSYALNNAYGIAECICEGAGTPESVQVRGLSGTPAGYLRHDLSTCLACPAGSYCPQQFFQYACPTHSTSAAAASSLSQCDCEAGFYGEGGNCTVCPVNAYCPSNVHAPIWCSDNSTTLTLNQRTNVSDCVCKQGFYEAEQHTCVYCERDSFCYADDLYDCPNNATAPRGAKSVQSCVCDAGLKLYVSEEEDAACVGCASTQVCHSGGRIEYCASEAFNVNFRCMCDPGFYCLNVAFTEGGLETCSGVSDGGSAACTGCPLNHYCSQNRITVCPVHETAPTLSSSSAACACVPGYYRDSVTGDCTICPWHYYCAGGEEPRVSVLGFDQNLQTLTAGTVTLLEAVCVSGFFRTSKFDLCKPCPKNYYCPLETGVVLPNVVACPDNEFTLQDQSSAREECVCLAGFKLTAHGDIMKCLPCDVGERCQAGQVVEAACHVDNKVPNADHTACVCHVGFGLYNFQCQQCPPGSVKSVIGDQQCTYCGLDEFAVNVTTCLSCPAHASAAPGSSECVCTPPYIWDESSCVLCPGGHYFRPVSVENQHSSPQCIPCPTNSTIVVSPSMPLDYSACACDDGFANVPQLITDTLQCVGCSAGFYEWEGVCVQCPQNASSLSEQSGVASCSCHVDCHTQRLDYSCAGECAAAPPACEACVPGSFKPTFSSAGNTDECGICGVGEFQPAYAATECIDCPLHEFHYYVNVSLRGTCKCDPGYFRPNTTGSLLHGLPACEACARGAFKEHAGDGVCSPCAPATFNPYLNATYCFSCAAETASAVSYEHALARESLTASPALVLESNGTVTQGQSSVLACVCALGNAPSLLPVPEQGPAHSFTHHCSACEPGTYKEYKNLEPCSYCGTYVDGHGGTYLHTYGEDEYGAVSVHHCQTCPSNSGQNHNLIGPDGLRMYGVDTCKCFMGHENRTLITGCRNCSNYMIQPEYSDNFCTFCETGFYFVASHLVCQECSIADYEGGLDHVGLVLNLLDPLTYAWGTSASDCVCRPGHERLAVDDLCTPCSLGSSRPDISTHFCTDCGLDTFQNTTGQLACFECPLASATLGKTGSTDVHDCICGPGYEALQVVEGEAVCDLCAAGKFRTNRTREEYAATCFTCPADSFCAEGSEKPSPCPENEVSEAGSDELSDCQCPAGRGRQGGGVAHPNIGQNPCVLCPPGSFAPSVRNAACDACPDNKNTSALGAVLKSECQCVPGHGVSASALSEGTEDGDASCSPCLDGYFASGGRNIACFHCGWGAITEPPEAADSPDCCLCDAGIGVYEL